jgi:hypothetical protein
LIFNNCNRNQLIGYSTQQPIGYNHFNLKWAFGLLMCFEPLNLLFLVLFFWFLAKKMNTTQTHGFQAQIQRQFKRQKKYTVWQ